MIIHICDHNLKVDRVLQRRDTIVSDKHIELHRERGEGGRERERERGEEGKRGRETKEGNVICN